VSRKKQRFPQITGEQAHAALRWLHALGKVTAKDIETAFKHRDRLVAQIRARLEEIGGQGLRFIRGAESLVREPAKRRRVKVSAKARAAWALQGRYMGVLRPLSKADRAKVKKIREAKGVPAAISAAREFARWTRRARR